MFQTAYQTKYRERKELKIKKTTNKNVLLNSTLVFYLKTFFQLTFLNIIFHLEKNVL